jgi:hypothetical protein
MGRRAYAHGMRALLLLLLISVGSFDVEAQTLNRDLFSPVQDGFAPREGALRKTSPAGSNEPGTQGGKSSGDLLAPSRIGAIPTYGSPVASGAGTTGYDSFGRNRKKERAKYATKALNKFGLPAGMPSLSDRDRRGVSGQDLDSSRANRAVLPPPPSGPILSTPPKVAPPPSLNANTGPLAPSINGLVVGQPPRRRLKVDETPFDPVGIYYGSFLSKTAIEFSGGYDTNPALVAPARGSAFYVVSPELSVASDWARHSLSAELHGSYTGYGSMFPADISAVSGAPTTLDRPNLTSKIDGRVDVTRDTYVNAELRLLVATDNPGSPNIQTGLARYPVYATSGATLGLDQNFNRFNIALNGTFDRTSYQWSSLTDGSVSSNDDRDFNQYGGLARASYDWRPGVKPFVEFEADTRVHDEIIDRFGFQRDSDGGYLKAGSSFELSRLITGEAALGWSTRTYQDPRLDRISGLLTSASLVWTATSLTTAKFIATSSIDESPLPGVAGVFTRDYIVQVEHAFRRWLTGVAKFGYGTSDYEGLGRLDNRYTVSANLVYKLTRTYQIKGELRHDWLQTNAIGLSTQATIATLGVRVQQ